CQRRAPPPPPAAPATTGGAARSLCAEGWGSPALLLTQQFLGFVLLIRRLEADGHIWDGQNIFPSIDQKLDVRRHAGLEQQVFIIDPHDGIVGHHILDDRRRIAHLVHSAYETAGRKSVDGKSHLLTLGDVPHIGFIDVGMPSILERSLAMVNKVGAWREAATVCPTSTLREMTMPSTGERMTVLLRSTVA